MIYYFLNSPESLRNLIFFFLTLVLLPPPRPDSDLSFFQLFSFYYFKGSYQVAVLSRLLDPTASEEEMQLIERGEKGSIFPEIQRHSGGRRLNILPLPRSRRRRRRRRRRRKKRLEIERKWLIAPSGIRKCRTMTCPETDRLRCSFFDAIFGTRKVEPLYRKHINPQRHTLR